MKGASEHKYKAKTVRIPFKTPEEERQFESFIESHGLKKGTYLLTLVRKAMKENTYDRG